MLTEISIENFKAFGKKQRIPLKPITLLYGPNSSGKSSLIQVLLLFKQTLESMNRDIVLQPRGNYVDLGGYADFINDHDAKKTFSFGAGFGDYSAYWDVDKTEVSSKRSLEYTFSKGNKEEIAIELLNISDSLLSEPVASYKNIWNFPPLKKVVTKKGKSKSIRQNEEQWFAKLRRSLLVREFMNLKSEGYRGYPSFRFMLENFYDEGLIELEKEIKELRKTIRDLKSAIPDAPSKRRTVGELMNFIRKDPKGKWNESSRADLQSELQRKGKALSVFKKIFNALSNKSFDQFSTINDVDFDSLVSLSNCFPEDLMDGRESLFHDIKDFILLGSLYGRDRYSAHTLPTTWILDATELFRLHLNDLLYIGPLRAMPERIYPFSGNLPSDVGIDGRYTADILIARPDIVTMLNQWFAQFDLNYSLDVRQVKDIRDYYQILLIDRRAGPEAYMKDVGFGISQVVPILVQGLVAENKILCIEQPEIHLHPRLQADLGDFLIHITEETGHYANTRNQVIIETHSEHLILRLLRRIRETTNGELGDEALVLRPEHVAVIYAKPTENGSELMELRISEDGDFIDRWPDGFFTERARELF